MQNEAQQPQEQATYGGGRPVCDRDVYSLVRAREERLKSVEITIRHETAPVIRDITAFFGRFEDVQNERIRVDDPLHVTCQVVLGIQDLEGWRYMELRKLEKPEPSEAVRQRHEEYKKTDEGVQENWSS